MNPIIVIVCFTLLQSFVHVYASPTNEVIAAFNELHDILSGATVVSYDGDSVGNTESCPSNTKVIFGYTAHFADGEGGRPSCTIAATNGCTVDATSCTIPTCNTNGNDESFIHMLCGQTVIPSSVIVSETSNSASSLQATCPGDKKIVFGFSYHYIRNDPFPTCAIQNNKACPIGASTCTMTACSTPDPLRFIVMLCADAKYSQGLTTYGSSVSNSQRNSGNSLSINCPAEQPVLLMGSALTLGPGFTTDSSGSQSSLIAAENFLCKYSPTTPACTQRGVGTDGDDYQSIHAICTSPKQPIVVQPTKSPTTLQPTKSPTTLQPTESPTTLPPTKSPNEFPPPTTSPLNNPTTSPTNGEGNDQNSPAREENSNSAVGIGVGVSAGVLLLAGVFGVRTYSKRKSDKEELLPPKSDKELTSFRINPTNLHSSFFKKKDNTDNQSSSFVGPPEVSEKEKAEYRFTYRDVKSIGMDL